METKTREVSPAIGGNGSNQIATMRRPPVANGRLTTFNKRLQELQALFDKAHSLEVPTFAPQQYNEALSSFRKSLADWNDRVPEEDVLKLLADVKEKLTNAADRAASSKEICDHIVALRKRIVSDESLRYHSAGLLRGFEKYAQEAIRMAEVGDEHAARASAETAKKVFLEATLSAIEAGPIRSMENRLAEVEELLPPARVHAATEFLSELRAAMDSARAGELEISALRKKVGIGRREIGGLTEISDDPGPDDLVEPPPGLGFHPETWKPPKAPTQLWILDRSSSSIKMKWKDRSCVDDANYLELQEGDGPWEAVREWGPVSGWVECTVNGLNPDTRYGFRVKAENEYGPPNRTPIDKRVYAHTLLDLPVWRVQLMIRTADCENAGTPNDVRVCLNSGSNKHWPRHHFTWLDHGPRAIQPPWQWQNDFQRGAEFTYDMTLKGIRDLADITCIRIEKVGTNALRIAEITLKVNGVDVFDRHFGETAESCLWIDEGDGYQPSYTISHAELRTHEKWQAYVAGPPSPPFQISNEEIVSRIEGIVGHTIHDTKAYWGKRMSNDYVVVTGVDQQTLHVRVNLKAAVMGPNPTLTIDFDLVVSIQCDEESGSAKLTLHSENLEVDADPSGVLGEIASLLDWIPGLDLDGRIEKEIKAAWKPIAEQIVFTTGGLCPTVMVDEYGWIVFSV